jgi:hypothetical protein
MNRRPQLTLLGHSASPQEAAAVVAAIEQFLRDTAPVIVAAEERPSGWIRAARLEAVGEPHEPGAWGDPHPWG